MVDEILFKNTITYNLVARHTGIVYHDLVSLSRDLKFILSRLLLLKVRSAEARGGLIDGYVSLTPSLT